MKKFTLDIKRVDLAHKCELTEQNKCDYSSGRGIYGLVFCLSGNATYKFMSGESLNVSEEDVIIIGKNAAYKLIIHSPFTHFTVNFDIHEENSHLPMPKNGYYKIKAATPDEYKRAFFELTKGKSVVGEELTDMSFIGKVYEIFGMIARDEEEKNNEKYEYIRLKPAKQLIEKHAVSSKISLEALAKISNMSVTNFRREWKRIYKNTPLEYRDVLRLQKAKELLAAYYVPIIEIAEKCGFEDCSYFVRFFKKHTGLTPGEYRKSLAIL